MAFSRIVDYEVASVRAAAILTNSYVAGTVLSGLQADNQLILDVQFTLGSLTSGEVRVEFSDDNTTWFQQSSGSVTAGTITISLAEYTFAATGNYRLEIPIKAAFVRVSAKGTGTVTASSMTIDARIGQN